MIALVATQDLMSLRLSNFDLILTSEFQRGLDRFRTARREVDGAISEVIASESQQLLRILLCYNGRELAGVNELQLRSLLSHRLRDFGDAMADEIHGGGAGEIHTAITVRVPNVNAFASYCEWKFLAE